MLPLKIKLERPFLGMTNYLIKQIFAVKSIATYSSFTDPIFSTDTI
ncbi:hypothetical protein RINTHH_21470 [Richelia intracellularis HH01]|uniref:Uncharacterized protein n=1 Tax=Richelia intracellularis HH01 TaxID=1165094 RepID=M1X0I6_9NOST|nr:hypothetical protein RINTHH_21470 [Richelia intracellularis HH01]